jgi:hypothetical protein
MPSVKASVILPVKGKIQRYPLNTFDMLCLKKSLGDYDINLYIAQHNSIPHDCQTYDSHRNHKSKDIENVYQKTNMATCHVVLILCCIIKINFIQVNFLMLRSSFIY